MGWQQFMPKALTDEQINALIAAYPDDAELWKRAWIWFDQQAESGVPYAMLQESTDRLELIWNNSKGDRES